MAGAVQSCGKLNHFELVCKNQSRQVPKDDKRCREVHNMYQDDEDKEVATQKFYAVRSEVFNFCNIRSIITVKIKAKTS